MTVNKLQRFEEVAEFDHVLEHTDFQDADEIKPKGIWKLDIFGNEHPIILELACGTGAYTLELARRNPHQNYIGIDIKGARIWKGAKNAKAEDLGNVRFMRMFIDHLDEYFDRGEVDEIWITFADPFSRAGDRKKRLTSPRFLKQYQQILEAGQPVHFKTDDTPFFDYTCRKVEQQGGTVVKKVEDIYSDSPKDDILTIKTTYEKKHLRAGKKISYCKFLLPKNKL